MSKKPLQSFYAAGKALALAELGTDAGVTLRDMPSMTALQVITTVAGGHFKVDLPTVSETGHELFPIVAGSIAIEQAAKRGEIKIDKAALERAIGGCIIECTRMSRFVPL
jgi:hypothetical protein